LASASTKSGEWRRPSSSAKSTCKATVDHLVSRYRFFGLPRFTGLPAKLKEELPAYRATVAMIKPLEE
jgi:hypothetical protein